MKQRDHTIDAVKGFAILLVMVGHCIVLNHMEEGYLYDAIKAVQMPLFMAVSGYLAGVTLEIESGRMLCVKLGKRAMAYLVPFVSWIFVLHVADFPKRLIKTLFQPDLGLWFLLVLFVLTFILYVAVYVKDCKKGGWVGFAFVVGLSGVLLAIQYKTGNSFLGPHLTINYLPFYIGGYVAGIWKKSGRGLQPYLQKGICGVSTVLFLFLIVRFDMVHAHSSAEWILQLFASALGTIVCFWGISRLPENRGKQFLAWTGGYTLEIYVLHFHFARILGMEDAGLSLYSIKGAAVVLTTLLLMSILTAFMIFTLKKLWITDFLLFGKRKTKQN